LRDSHEPSRVSHLFELEKAMKKRPSDQSPWMPAPTVGRSIRPGIGINLLVEDVARSVRFATTVLGATATYADVDFALMRVVGADWMFHADHTYRDNPVSGLLEGVTGRGAGIELRLYGVDPDAAGGGCPTGRPYGAGRSHGQAAWPARVHHSRR